MSIKTTNLATLFPDLIKEWHPSKNDELKPQDFTYGSDRKVWWVCNKGHEWQSRIANRTIHGNSCPGCSGRVATIDNNFAKKYPELLKMWDFKRNEIGPEEVTPSSNKKVWWICSEGHSFFQSPNHIKKGTGCGFCAGYLVGKDNNLQIVFPDVASQWNWRRNKTLKPSEVYFGSSKKVWWVCPKGHEWEAKIISRTFSGKNCSPTGCPKCFPHTSKEEIRLLSELKMVFDDVSWRKVYGRYEIDILIDNLNIAFEYDGKRWHPDPKKDEMKNKFFLSKGIRVFRLRQGLEKITPYDVIVNGSLSKESVNQLLLSVTEFVPKRCHEKIMNYISAVNFVNDRDFRALVAEINFPKAETSLQEKYPEIASQWDYLKNHPLKPEDFSFSSKTKVWWKCDKGTNHIWQTSISNRTGRNNTGCPFCAKNRPKNFFVFNSNDELIGEWATQAQCAKDLNLSATSLNMCLNGRRGSHRGYKFQFK